MNNGDAISMAEREVRQHEMWVNHFQMNLSDANIKLIEARERLSDLWAKEHGIEPDIEYPITAGYLAAIGGDFVRQFLTEETRVKVYEVNDYRVELFILGRPEVAHFFVSPEMFRKHFKQEMIHE